jgi:2-oxoglutarate/2-oxoacid ferredoxin oxidoreductase subunit beta
MLRREDHEIYEFLRHKKKFPGVWCAGCGIGIVLGSIIRAVDSLGLDKNNVAMVSGIGCSGRMSVYVDFNTMHTTHGRALAFATGLKMARPDMHVIVVMGDGDALAIGGNHFIHSARRNIDLTAIVINNSIYGMTGGQYSPTTPEGFIASTAPYGTIERHFSICDLASAAGGFLCGAQHGLSCARVGSDHRTGYEQRRLCDGRGSQLLPHDLRAYEQDRFRRRDDA